MEKKLAEVTKVSKEFLEHLKIELVVSFDSGVVLVHELYGNSASSCCHYLGFESCCRVVSAPNSCPVF